MPDVHELVLHRDEFGQFIVIPLDHELPGTTAMMRREGDRLIIELDLPAPP